MGRESWVRTDRPQITDPGADRVLYIGALAPVGEGGTFHHRCPQSAAEEWEAFRSLLRVLPERGALLHYGPHLPRWFAEASCGRSVLHGRYHFEKGVADRRDPVVQTEADNAGIVIAVVDTQQMAEASRR